MNTSPLLSVIIPLYNCADIIERCLDSIDYLEAEIIVVDDGSTDDGAAIVAQYATNHPNVYLLRKENGGVSSARNMGLDNAHGQYIMFVDADDYVAADGIERVLKLAIEEDADVLKYNAKYPSATDPVDRSSLKDIPFTIRRLMGRAEALRHYDLSDYVIWDGLYKRSVIEEHHIRFEESLHLHEDDVFMGTILCYSKKFVEVDLRLYRYIMASAQSSTHRLSQDKVKRLIDSSLTAIRFRKDAIQNACPNAKFPLERYKHMRYAQGCIWMMLENKYTFEQIKPYIDELKALNVYPLAYHWIRVARMGYSKKKMFKYVIKTWICNHPEIYLMIKNTY